MIDPAAKRRGADPAVPEKTKNQKIGAATEKKLEQGLEESMAGSDPQHYATCAGSRVE